MNHGPRGAAIEAPEYGGTAFGARVMRRLDELARFSSEPDALTRLFLTPEHKAAATQVAALHGVGRRELYEAMLAARAGLPRDDTADDE